MEIFSTFERYLCAKYGKNQKYIAEIVANNSGNLGLRGGVGYRICTSVGGASFAPARYPTIRRYEP